MKVADMFYGVIKRLAQWRPASLFFAKTLHRIDAPLLRWSRNRSSLTSLLTGLPVATLITRGAKSGLERSVPLIPQVDGEKLVFISSNFGQEHFPGWHYNLKAQPWAKVALRGATRSYHARLAEGDERQKYWEMAVRSYPGYASYARHASHRQIGVWVLEPAEESER